jgi:hypothetical protein
MTSSEEDKRQIMNDLARGNHEPVESIPAVPEQEYQTFDDLAQRSSPDERSSLFGKSFHPERILPSQMEPELEKAIAQIQPNERHKIAREFLKRLKERELSDRDLEQELSLSTRDAKRMTVDDVTKLAAYTYHNHPDIFQNVLAERPAIVKFLSNPLVGTILGAMAIKWLGNHRDS